MKMLVIGFLCPVWEKTRMKLVYTKQGYFDYVLGEKFLTKIEKIVQTKKIFIFLTGKFSRIIRPTPVIKSQGC